MLHLVIAVGIATDAAATPTGREGSAPTVLNCYVVQSSALGLGQFVRHLRIDKETGVVSISDGLRGGAVRFIGNGQLVAFDAARIVFDYESAESSGRTTIDRRSGRLLYRDGRATVSGSCQPGEL